MRRWKKLLVGVLACLLPVMTAQADASIIIDGEVVQTDTKNPIIEACEKMQAQLAWDIENGRQWTYSNRGVNISEDWYTAASHTSKHSCNCALLARWALREAGLVPKNNGGYFYGRGDGTVRWSEQSKAEIEATCEIYHVNGTKTVDQMIADGTLAAGDILTYQKIGHTNIYAGDNKFYDAGHAYCNGSGELAVYRSWYGNSTVGSQPVAYLIRMRQQTSAPAEPDIVITDMPAEDMVIMDIPNEDDGTGDTMESMDSFTRVTTMIGTMEKSRYPFPDELAKKPEDLTG